MKRPVLLAVSGVKDSGKTTWIERVLPILKARGLKTAVIKHDGHEFAADVPGTDTWRHLQAGAWGTAIFSRTQYMLVKKQPSVSEEELCSFFQDADLILLEGFKDSKYPKFELIRAGRLNRSVCRGKNLLAVFSDLKREEIEDLEEGVPVWGLDQVEKGAELICCYVNSVSREVFSAGKRQESTH